MKFGAVVQTLQGEIAKWRRPKDSTLSTCIALHFTDFVCDLGSFDFTSVSRSSLTSSGAADPFCD